MRQLIPLLLLCVLTLVACDNPTSKSTVEYRYKGLLPLLSASAETIPVVFHASPGSNVDAYILQALATRSQESGISGIRFAAASKRPVTDLTIEVAYQPDREKTGISLCQQKPVGGLETSQKSIVLAMAICRDGRRLSSVRGAESQPGDIDGNAAAMTALVNTLTASLIGK